MVRERGQNGSHFTVGGLLRQEYPPVEAPSRKD